MESVVLVAALRWWPPCTDGRLVQGTVRSMLEPGEHAGPDLAREMRLHMEEDFPASVRPGGSFGEVEPSLIGADVYGWALRVSRGERLPVTESEWFAIEADKLERSICAFPQAAQPYYQRVLRIARLALGQAGFTVPAPTAHRDPRGRR